MSFNSIPATKLRKRLDLNPSLSLDFGTGLARDTVLFSEEPFVNIKAEKAEFSSTVSFSGRAKYNFWKFKVSNWYRSVIGKVLNINRWNIFTSISTHVSPPMLPCQLM